MLNKIISNKFMNGYDYRPYQRESLEIVKNSRLNGDKRGLILLPPGTGKTLIAYEDALNVLNEFKEAELPAQILIVVPNKIIREQKQALVPLFDEDLKLFTTFENKWDPRKVKNADVILTTYQYFGIHQDKFKKLDLPIEYIILDEALHSFCNTYQKVIKTYHTKDRTPAYILGLAPTQYSIIGAKAQEISLEIHGEERKMVALEEIFNNNLLIDQTSEKDITKMIRQGYLAEIFVKRSATTTAVEFKKKYRIFNDRGDFEYNTPLIYSHLAAIAKKEFNELLLAEFKDIPENRQGKPTTIIALSIKHANDLEKHFQNNGVNAKAFHSKLKPSEQTKRLASFENGEFNTLIVVDKLKEGYDYPEIEVVIQARPIYSRPLYIQHIGRSWRRTKNKSSCLIIDIPWTIGKYSSYTMHTVFNRTVYRRPIENFFTKGPHIILKGVKNKDTLEIKDIVRMSSIGIREKQQSNLTKLLRLIHAIQSSFFTDHKLINKFFINEDLDRALEHIVKNKFGLSFMIEKFPNLYKNIVLDMKTDLLETIKKRDFVFLAGLSDYIHKDLANIINNRFFKTNFISRSWIKNSFLKILSDEKIIHKLFHNPHGHYLFFKRIVTSKVIDEYRMPKSIKYYLLKKIRIFNPSISTKEIVEYISPLCPFKELESTILSDTIYAVLKDFAPKQKLVIRMRYGLAPYSKSYTYKQIGTKLGYSSTRIQQIEDEAIHRLRHPSRSQALKIFL
ncbi:DEAD/DEAH box helicase family protein [Candidatus Margulisiibacteriota bacterium]